MPKLVEYCDVVMGNIWSATPMIGTAIDEQIHDKKSKEAYLDMQKQRRQRSWKNFESVKYLPTLFRFDKNGNDILYYTSLFKDSKLYSTPDFTCRCVVDRSGSGDCFTAGLIYVLTKGLPPQELLKYATCCSIRKAAGAWGRN